MTVEEEAHWRYQLERMERYGWAEQQYHAFQQVPDEVKWLREQAKYKCHLADAQARRRND